MSRRRTTSAAVALLLGAPLLAACSDGSAGSGGGTFVAALEELPAPGGDARALRVTWADLDAVARANGFDEVPGRDDDARGDYVAAMAGVGDDSVVLAPQSAFDARLVTDDDLGFGWITSEVTASVTNAGGDDFSWYRAADDVEAGGDLDEVDDGVFRDGGLFAGIDGREAVLTATEDAATDWRHGDADTLADDERIAAVAGAIDDADALSGVVVALGGDDLLGIGWVDDDGDPAFVMVYALGSADAARDAEDRLREGFDGLDDEVRVDDVTSDGELVVVTGHQVSGVNAPLRMLESARLPLP